ncbi:ABC transporter permease [Ectothiorhodosinus mongolicus]|nr:ABC transporter permease [Ectothiorhodosinus mongolicus]
MALVGIALGVAIVIAVDLANSSATRAFALSLDTVTGRATHQIIGGPAGIDETLYARLRQAGWRDSAPVVEGYVRIQGETFTLMGVDPFAEAGFRDQANPGSGGEFGALLTTPGAIVLAEATAARLGLSLDQPVLLSIQGREATARVLEVIADDTPGLEGLVFTDISHAQRFLQRPGRLDRIDLILPGEVPAELLAMLPPDVELIETQVRNAATLQLTRAFHINLTAMSLLALLVGGFLIYNAMVFSVLRRRPILARLRFQGVTRGQLFGMVLSEALVLAVLGSAVGILLGSLLGQWLLQFMTRTIRDLYFVLSVTEAPLTTVLVLKGLLLGLGVTLLAALSPALEAARVSPADALRRSHLESSAGRLLPWLSLAGLLMIVVGAVMVVMPSQSLLLGFVALFLLILGGAFWVPSLLSLASRSLGQSLGNWLDAVSRVAIRGVRAGISRTGLAVAALTVAVAATIGVGIMVASFRMTVDVWLGQTLQSDIYLSAPGRSGLGASPRLPEGLFDAVLGLPAMAEVSAAQRVPVQSSAGTVELMAVTPAERTAMGYHYRSQSMDARSIWQVMQQQPAVTISEPLAWRTDLRVGDALTLRTDQGLVDFEILGVFQEYGSDRGLVTMHRQQYDRWWADGSIASLGLYLHEGVAVAEAMDALRQLLSGWDAEVLVTSSGEIRELSMEIFDRTFAITHILRLLTVGVAFVGIFSALTALQMEQVRENALLRATGMTPWQLGRMVVSQSLVLGLVAAVAAIPLGVMMSVVLIEVINQRSFGWSMQTLISARVLWEGALLAFAAALLAGLYPGYRMARTSPALHLRSS